MAHVDSYRLYGSTFRQNSQENSHRIRHPYSNSLGSRIRNLLNLTLQKSPTSSEAGQ